MATYYEAHPWKNSEVVLSNRGVDGNHVVETLDDSVDSFVFTRWQAVWVGGRDPEIHWTHQASYISKHQIKQILKHYGDQLKEVT